MVDVNISIRSTEGSDATEPMLLWDTVWNSNAYTLDWALAGNSEPSNSGGLQATQALNTAILIQLATHKRAPSYLTLPAGSDPKGWWGDTIDLEDGETQIGSWLWLLYRSTLTDDVARQAVSYVEDCLQPIIGQGAVVRFDVSYQMNAVRSVLGIQIDGYSQDGQLVYSQKFARLWQQEFESAGISTGNLFQAI